MAKFTKLNIGDAVASSGGRVWKRLSAESAEPAESIVGTWVFNDTIDVQTVPYGRTNKWNVDFTLPNNDNAVCNGFYRYNSMDGIASVLAYSNGETDSFTNVYATDSDMDADKGWRDRYKTINITSEPTDEAFITWLKANATKQTTTRRVTIRINNSYDATFPIPDGASTWSGMDNVYSNNYSDLMIDVVGSYVEIIQSSGIYAAGRIFVRYVSEVAPSDTISSDLAYECTLSHSGGSG